MKYLHKRLIQRSKILEKFFFENEKNISELFVDVENSISNSGKLILIGNGGSFAIAQHISAEFTGRFVKERDSIPSFVLGSNPSSFSAISNDYGYENSFSREFSSLANKKDILIAMSVSGKSKNILKTLEASKVKSIKSYFLTGQSKEKINVEKILGTNLITVPSSETAIVQEIHFTILHELCNFIDENYSSLKNL